MLTQTYRGAALAIAVLALLGLSASACGGDSADELILATTTSTQDSGLLDVLIPDFEDQYDYNVKVIAVGSGQAMEMGGRGDADVLLVHSPSAEQEFMDAGNGTNRQLVMHNDFIIIGPADDPAGVADAETAADAFTAIADAGASFISRGDDSGTNARELAIWEDAGIDPSGESWYEASGQGMGPTLQIANQTGAYTLSDRATFLANGDTLDLEILSEGDAALLNIYHVIQVNPDKFDGLNADGAADFVAFMIAAATQETIGTFGVEDYGQPLFFPDAGKSEDDLAVP
jgi:tungstate transport system substrate-binding protein